eukprot:GHVP01027993.1.p1 GENE.GHVP01027993.1~~GHVP01027993.1.p1  ORF type:complete len:140 (-),score=13.36 GHVP01027993.1:62-481(-)
MTEEVRKLVMGLRNYPGRRFRTTYSKSSHSPSIEIPENCYFKFEKKVKISTAALSYIPLSSDTSLIPSDTSLIPSDISKVISSAAADDGITHNLTWCRRSQNCSPEKLWLAEKKEELLCGVVGIHSVDWGVSERLSEYL